jgi:glycosyltransferase involved in cell wall biosynthesis
MRAAVTLEQCWHRVPGGTARAVLETVSAMDALGEVDLVGVAARHSTPATASYEPPIPVEQLPLPRPVLYETWHGLRRPRVERATGPVDLVHATGVAVPPRSKPLVVTVHDLAYLHDERHFTRHGIRFFRRALELTRRDADLVLCSSQATFDDCARNGVGRERLRLIPLGVRATRAVPSAVDATRTRRGLGRPYVLFVGTLEPRKNLPVLVDAFARLDRADLDLVIVGPAGWGEDIGPRVAALGDRVKLLGFVVDEELAALYAGAAVFCYPSLLEGFGLPVLESMAQGTPVVTSSGTATEELVAGGAGLAVDPRSPDGIAEALAAVLDDPTLAAGFRAAGLRRVAEHTWERTARLTIDAYREVT